MHPHTEEAQDWGQSVIIIGSSDNKRSAREISSFSHCQQVYGDKSPPEAQPSVYYHGVLSPAWQVFATGTLKDRVFQPQLPVVQINAVWRHRGLQVCTYLQNELLGWVGHQDSVAPGWTSRVHVLLSLARVLTVGITANKSQPQPSMTLGKAAWNLKGPYFLQNFTVKKQLFQTLGHVYLSFLLPLSFSCAPSLRLSQIYNCTVWLTS